MSGLPLASVRSSIADYILALGIVYTILIFAYVLFQLLYSLGARFPYARWFEVLQEWLRDVCEPFLRIFRRILPMIGPLDISPIVAVIVLNFACRLLARAVQG